MQNNRMPWLYNEPPARETLLASYRNVLYSAVNWRMGPDVSLIGFKEVRWLFTEGLGDVDILLEMLPCAKLLLSYRTDVETQASSGFWTLRHNNHTKVIHELSNSNEALLQLHARLPDQTRLVSLAQLGSVPEMQAVFDWMETGWQQRLGCRVVSVPHYNQNGTMDKASLADECTASGCKRRADYVNKFLNVRVPLPPD
jgi:hypothetical protein